jgi:hypothetical protein
LGVLNHEYDHRQSVLEESATMPLAGGIMQHGYQCGMIWGAALAAGAQAYRLYGPGPKAECKAIHAARRLVESFHAQNKNINCMEITDIDKSSTGMELIIYFLVKGGSIGCFRRAAKYAPLACDEINSSLSEDLKEIPSNPVSCTSVLAEKIGLSDKHRMMVAGFAGGIGLSGGGCGALGAAIWILSMRISKEENGKVDFDNPRANELIEKFMKSTDYEFECSNIVGRKFDNIEDHARYLRDGGCSELIKMLARL